MMFNNSILWLVIFNNLNLFENYSIYVNFLFLFFANLLGLTILMTSWMTLTSARLWLSHKPHLLQRNMTELVISPTEPKWRKNWHIWSVMVYIIMNRISLMKMMMVATITERFVYYNFYLLYHHISSSYLPYWDILI